MPDSPFNTMWLQPRATIRQLIETDPTRHVLLLAALSGISEFLNRCASLHIGDIEKITQQSIVLGAGLLGPIAGLLSLYITAFLIRFTGRLFSGVATTAQLRAALAWGSLPNIFTLLLWGLLLNNFGKDLFVSGGFKGEYTAFQLNLFQTSLTIMAICNVWGIILISKSVAEVQGYRSACAGLANIILGICLLAVPMLIITMLILGPPPAAIPGPTA
ncbi:YIP1 family protein [Planctomicrobium sp. SH668]|uniref:YIP1 family protein n=1 Tax=Planctomicrobium sp. SH668 TaxID=3448126 RepID=UPI003F5C90EC